MDILNIKEIEQTLLNCMPPAKAASTARAMALSQIGMRAKLITKLAKVSRNRAKYIFRLVQGRSSTSGQFPDSSRWFLGPIPRVLSAGFWAAFEAAPGDDAEKLVAGFLATPSDEPGWTPERAMSLVHNIRRGDVIFGECRRCKKPAIAENYHIICPDCDPSRPLLSSALLRKVFQRRGGKVVPANVMQI
ncbi:MAG: FlhC family transcriptional regulator [Sulfuricella sp.]